MPPFSHETTAHDDSLDDEFYDRDHVRRDLDALRDEVSHTHARDDDDEENDDGAENETDPREELDDIAEEAGGAGLPEVAAVAEKAKTFTAPDVARTAVNFLDKTISALEKLIADMEKNISEQKKPETGQAASSQTSAADKSAAEKPLNLPSKLLADGKKAFEKYSGNMKEKEANLFEYSTGYFTINLNPQFSIQNNQWRVRWRTSEDWKDPEGVAAPSSWLNNSKAEIDDILQALAKANAEYTLTQTTAPTNTPAQTTEQTQAPSQTQSQAPTQNRDTPQPLKPLFDVIPLNEDLIGKKYEGTVEGNRVKVMIQNDGFIMNEKTYHITLDGKPVVIGSCERTGDKVKIKVMYKKKNGDDTSQELTPKVDSVMELLKTFLKKGKYEFDTILLGKLEIQ
ncbi:hypothetical protein HY213_00570 [Candidatus Peregrinibacteria bacterium]|nr:hypothetical protein [Candidatus Peregrinibacteria bacterium]